MNGEIWYRLNQRDEIVCVSGGWERADATSVLGRPLWHFISDASTKALYRDIVARVRAGIPVRFTLRCDSSACRRGMEMEVLPLPDRHVEFRTRIVWEQPRAPQALLEDVPRSEEFVRVCGWCKKVDVGGRWVEVEEAVSLLGLFDRPLYPKLTHTICDGCNTLMLQVVEASSPEAEPATALAVKRLTPYSVTAPRPRG